MPFQSEKQRRYLWANEPEIARDWTDTYGSGIAKALGGRIGFWNGSGNIRQQPHQPRDLLVQNNPYGTRPRYQPPGGGATSLGSGRDVGRSDRAGHSQHATANVRNIPPPARPSIGPSLHGEGVGPEALSGQQANLRSFVRDQEIQRQAEMGNQYSPTFGQRFKMGIGNLFSGLGGGLRNLAGFINPLAFAIDNPYARLGINYLGKKFAPNLYNKWSNQDPTWTDPDEQRDILREFNMQYPLDLSQYDKPVDKYEWDKGPDTMAHDYLSLSKFSDKQKKKAEKELGWGVEPKNIMPKLQQDDPTSWGFKTEDAIKAQEFIGWLETEKGMQLTEDQKREIYEAAGQEMEDPI